MPDEHGGDFDDWAERFDGLFAPWLFWAEIRNILVMNERRGRIEATEVDVTIPALEKLRITLDTTPSSATVMDLARRHRLTVHDALYLELAQRRGAALATLDRALAEAARAEGVAVA
jgi:predicted nucleic acid-binding protein